ncbi:hypothetical protein IIC68_01560, partial [archaeon]|nr:hypothetical protein [archaeon]
QEIQQSNPGIKFNFILAKNLERVFFELNEEDMLALGFDIDSRKSVTVANSLVSIIEDEIDRESIETASHFLEVLQDLCEDIDDEELLLTCGLLKASVHQKSEQTDLAISGLRLLCDEYKESVRPLLKLAEILLSVSLLEENEKLIFKAAQIDPISPLLKLQKIVRDIRLGKNFEVVEVNEAEFSKDPKVISALYRLYGLALLKDIDSIRGDTFLNKALELNPIRFVNHLAILQVESVRLMNCKNSGKKRI